MAPIFSTPAPNALFLPHTGLITTQGLLHDQLRRKYKPELLCITSWYHTEIDSFNHIAPPGIAHKLKREILPLGSTSHGPHHQERETE